MTVYKSVSDFYANLSTLQLTRPRTQPTDYYPSARFAKGSGVVSDLAHDWLKYSTLYKMCSTT